MCGFNVQRLDVPAQQYSNTMMFGRHLASIAAPIRLVLNETKTLNQGRAQTLPCVKYLLPYKVLRVGTI